MKLNKLKNINFVLKKINNFQKQLIIFIFCDHINKIIMKIITIFSDYIYNNNYLVIIYIIYLLFLVMNTSMSGVLS